MHSANFLHQTEPPKQRRAHRRRRWVRVVLFALLSLFALWVILILFAAGQVTAAALDGKDALEKARTDAEELDFAAAGEDLARADDRLSAAARGFALLRTARILPFVSAQIDAADALLSGGREVISGLTPIVELGAELVRLTGFSQDELRLMGEGVEPTVTFDELSSETKRAVLERLASSAGDLQLLSARIAIARADLADIDRSELLQPVADALVPFDARLGEAQSAIQTLSIAAQLLPEFAGLGEERAHLLLFLNDTELRPAGGFIGTYGVLRMMDGDIHELETHDSYAVDRLAEPYVTEVPPSPLGRYLPADRWFFRDANWSPDFETSVRNAMRLYAQETDLIPPDARAAAGIDQATFDGAIGITPAFLSDLLSLTGPLTVGGQTFDAENVTDKLEYQVEVGYAGQGIPEEQRKEVIGDLMNAVKSKLFSIPLSDLPGYTDLLNASFAEKHLALMSTNPDTEKVIQAVGWGGQITPPSGDVQLFVDANLASLKTDPVVSRAIRYEIFRNTSGQYVGRTSVTYAHTGTFDWKTTRYRTYARLYVPLGSTLVRAEGAMRDDKLHDPAGTPGSVDVQNDLGLTSFGAFVSIEPGETRTLTFEYLLADSVVERIKNGAYDLSVLKQMGAGNAALTLDLDFDKTVTSASVPEDRGEWGDDTYRLNTELSQDVEFEVGL